MRCWLRCGWVGVVSTEIIFLSFFLHILSLHLLLIDTKLYLLLTAHLYFELQNWQIPWSVTKGQIVYQVHFLTKLATLLYNKCNDNLDQYLLLHCIINKSSHWMYHSMDGIILFDVYSIVGCRNISYIFSFQQPARTTRKWCLLIYQLNVNSMQCYQIRVRLCTKIMINYASNITL